VVAHQSNNAAAAATDEQVNSLPYVQKYRDIAASAGLKKMAIRDLQPGPAIDAKLGGMVRHDFSHLLRPEHQKDYQLYGEFWPEQPDTLYTRLIHKPTGERVGHIDAGVGHTEEGRKGIEVTVSDLKPELRGKGMGRALYEAALGLGYHKMGLKHVVGDVHSSMAHNVHESITQHHGFPGYAPDKIGRSKGANDNAFGSYEYKLR
jgi:hypothetical protein